MQESNKIDLKKLTIFSENGKEIDVCRGIVELHYHESILENSVKVSFTFADTGYREKSDDAGVFEEDDLDLQGGEKVYLQLEDDLGKQLNFINDDYQLRILRVPNNIEDTQKTGVVIHLCTKEYILNELEDYYITKRYDGKISDSVTKILKDVLKTPKKLDIEETLNSFNFLGHVEKVFYKLVWLAKRSVPNLPGIKGQSAGFFFYEISDGFKYKSIDSLIKQKPKRKLIFNNTTLLPKDYDAKILNRPVFAPTIDVMQKLRLGTYDNKLITFDLFDNKYKEKVLDADENSAAELAGKKLPKLPKDFKIPSRRSSGVRDTGVLPPGDTLSVQLEKAKELNFEIEDILNQSFMRYNQLFAVRTSITIFADLELHAGDMIFCDFPELSSKANQIISNKKSGKYLIVDLTHYVSTNGPSYTKLNIVRDSYYRKTA
jgi:hypothetical protein